MRGEPHVTSPFLLAAGVAALGTALFATAAAAQQAQQCDQRARVIGHLAQKYWETPVAIGVTNRGGLVEVLTSVDGKTWTIIVSLPNGTSCLVAAGEGWRMLAPVEKGPGV